MQNGQKKILVTAVAGDLGQAIVKSLRLIPEPLLIVGCDISPDTGAAFADEIFSVPPGATAGYLDRINHICKSSEIDAIIPASEAEMLVLGLAVAENNFSLKTPLVCQKINWMEKFGDKLSCYRELENKVELAAFVDGLDSKAVEQFASDYGFPLIVKSRRGSGSRNVQLVNNKNELKKSLEDIPQPVVQQFIVDDFGEFSVGVFSCDQFTRAVSFKRELGPVGNSWYADNHDQDKDVLSYCLKIAKDSGLRGSCNIQVRKSSQGVRLLEINPRFSSLVAARAICGFKDLEWSLRLALGEQVETPVETFRKVRFRRYFHELVDLGEGYAAPPEWQPKQLAKHREAN